MADHHRDRRGRRSGSRDSAAGRSAAALGSALVWVLASIVVATLSGCGRSGFEFIVTDEAGSPLEGVEVSYQIESQGAAESMVVGVTDAAGVLVVSGKHFAIGRQYLFRKACTASASGERFDPASCAILTGGGSGQYTFALRDGLVRRPDLGRKPAGRKWPGRTVKLTCEAASEGTPSEDRQQTLARIIDLTAPAGARVSANGRAIGTVPDGGWLNTEFCPGDSAACFATTVTITITLEGYAPYAQEAALPEPLGTVKLTAELRPGAPGATTASSAPAGATVAAGSGGSTAASPGSSAGGLVQVRVKNGGVPQACGPEGGQPPALMVNDQSTLVQGSSDSEGMETYFDLLLQPGQNYCIAVRCPDEEPGALSWNPWDASRAEPAWYSLRVPEDAARLYFVIPYKPGGNLRLTPQREGSWKGFNTARAVQVTRGCTHN
jgi:hypothetical protein